jgi:hypothetical protein
MLFEDSKSIDSETGGMQHTWDTACNMVNDIAMCIPMSLQTAICCLYQPGCAQYLEIDKVQTLRYMIAVYKAASFRDFMQPIHALLEMPVDFYKGSFREVVLNEKNREYETVVTHRDPLRQMLESSPNKLVIYKLFAQMDVLRQLHQRDILRSVGSLLGMPTNIIHNFNQPIDCLLVALLESAGIGKKHKLTSEMMQIVATTLGTACSTRMTPSALGKLKSLPNGDQIVNSLKRIGLHIPFH